MAYSAQEKDKIVTQICDLVASGLSLRKAIKEANTISRKVFNDWIEADPNKSDQYARAVEERTELKFDSIEQDYMEQPAINPTTGSIDNAWVALQRLKIDAKKWELSKMLPKKYGDKLDLNNNISGSVNVISLGSGKKPNETT